MALRRGSGVPQWNIVTMMPLTTIALLCRQIIDKFQTHPPPELPMTPSIGEPVIICSSLNGKITFCNLHTFGIGPTRKYAWVQSKPTFKFHYYLIWKEGRGRYKKHKNIFQ